MAASFAVVGGLLALRRPGNADGALPAPRWRWFSRPTLALVAAATVGMAVVSPADTDGYANLTYLPWVPQELALAVGLAALACFPVSVASVVIRYRRSGIVQRQQIRWVAWAAGIFVAVHLISAFPILPQAFSGSEAMTVVVLVAYALVPVSIGFAILRYRLYDIDKIVSRTVSYAVITGTLAGVYAGGVALLTGVLPFSGQAGTAASVLAAMALFAPLRRRVQRAVDRRFNRARYDAETVIAAFAGGCASQPTSTPCAPISPRRSPRPWTRPMRACGSATQRQVRPCTTENGVAVGVVPARSMPATDSRSRYSARVRSRPPVTASISTSSVLDQCRCGPSGMTASRRSTAAPPRRARPTAERMATATAGSSNSTPLASA